MRKYVCSQSQIFGTMLTEQLFILSHGPLITSEDNYVDTSNRARTGFQSENSSIFKDFPGPVASFLRTEGGMLN